MQPLLLSENHFQLMPRTVKNLINLMLNLLSVNANLQYSSKLFYDWFPSSLIMTIIKVIGNSISIVRSWEGLINGLVKQKILKLMWTICVHKLKLMWNSSDQCKINNRLQLVFLPHSLLCLMLLVQWALKLSNNWESSFMAKKKGWTQIQWFSLVYKF